MSELRYQQIFYDWKYEAQRNAEIIFWEFKMFYNKE